MDIEFNTINYYKYMVPKWVTMYLVFKRYFGNEAYDIFRNVASYYIHL